MAQKHDYAVKNGGSKKTKNSGRIGKLFLLSITAFLVILFAGALYLLKEKAQEPGKLATKTEKTQPKSQLPSRPEEVWSYIKELESRTVVVSNDAQKALAQNVLNEKQKAELLRLEEKEKQAALDKAMERAMQAEAQKKIEELAQQKPTLPEKDDTALKAEQAKALELKKQADQKKLAEQRKADEAKKKIEEAKKVATPETVKAESVKKTENAKTEPAKENKKEEQKKAETDKPAGRFGLQCGAFKNKEQANNLQARLVALGLNARVNSSAEWNRVIVGPLGDRSAAVSAQQKAASVINCVVLAM